MTRIIGVDYGTRKVGIAVSDSTRRFASPLIVLPNDSELVKKLAELIREHDAEEIVVGLSQNYQGKDNPVMESARGFATALERLTSAPVIWEPEFLTTAQAARTEENKRQLDASAAALILQSYLDRLNN